MVLGKSGGEGMGVGVGLRIMRVICGRLGMYQLIIIIIVVVVVIFIQYQTCQNHQHLKILVRIITLRC